jgi:hypothetical protein
MRSRVGGPLGGPLRWRRALLLPCVLAAFPTSAQAHRLSFDRADSDGAAAYLLRFYKDHRYEEFGGVTYRAFTKSLICDAEYGAHRVSAHAIDCSAEIDYNDTGTFTGDEIDCKTRLRVSFRNAHSWRLRYSFPRPWRCKGAFD